MDLLHEAYKQDTIRWTNKLIGSVAEKMHWDVHIFVGIIIFSIWIQTHGQKRWTRQL